jgi:uncharacterized protein (DUF3084 family)
MPLFDTNESQNPIESAQDIFKQFSPLNNADIELENKKLRKENEILKKERDKYQQEYNNMIKEHLQTVEELRKIKKENDDLKIQYNKLETKWIEPKKQEEIWVDPFSWALDSISDYVIEQFKVVNGELPRKDEQEEKEKSYIDHELPDR